MFRSRAAVSIVMLTRILLVFYLCRLRRPRLAAVAIEAAKTIVPVLHRGNPCASGASAGSAIVRLPQNLVPSVGHDARDRER
jgi:hypothetical protein